MNDSLRDLVSGRSRGAVPSAVRGGLRAASVGYGLGVRLRNRRFDRGLGVARAAVPVVSVGNLTAGGTGKTPVVAFLANRFRAAGRNVAILSRGYRALGEPRASARGPSACDMRRSNGRNGPPAHAGGSPRNGNDEARVLSLLCPGVPHVQKPDRIAGAAEAVAAYGADLLILDDGFQHRRLARDVDLVLIDATNPFGYGHLLPRGLLREPVDSLRRADAVLITRADLVSDEARADLRDAIRRVRVDLPIAEVAFPATGLVDAAGAKRPLAHLAGRPVLAFCGVGNPDGFRATLAASGLTAAGVVTFPDHHRYAPADLAALTIEAARCDAVAAVTTLKDLVKIPSATLPGSGPASSPALPLWAVETGVEVLRGGAAVLARVDALAGRAARTRAA